MIDELRIYRLVPGGLADYLRFSGEVAIPFRGTKFGELLGFWYAEIGAVNTVFNLWRHQDLNTRQALRAELAKSEVWRTQYQPKIQPLMQHQVIRLMTPVIPLATRPEGGNTYEVRFIRTKTGKAQELASRLQSDLPAEFQKETIGIWTTLAGEVNEVVHISAYRDVRARLKRSLEHPDWRHFLKEHGPLVEEIDSSLMLPAGHSPLQ